MRNLPHGVLHQVCVVRNLPHGVYLGHTVVEPFLPGIAERLEHDLYFILSIKTYGLAKGSSPGFLYCILAEVKIHYARDGESSYKSATRLPKSDFHLL